MADMRLITRWSLVQVQVAPLFLSFYLSAICIAIFQNQNSLINPSWGSSGGVANQLRKSPNKIQQDSYRFEFPPFPPIHQNKKIIARLLQFCRLHF
jgi:hypothetical protein